MVDARAFAQQVADELAVPLTGELVGVYLHGSLAFGCFNPLRSDIDLLAVTRARMSDRVRGSVAAVLLSHSGNPYPIEISFLAESHLRPWRHPTPYDFHYGEAYRERGGLVAGDHDRDADLAGHIGTLRERGEVLLGSPIAEVFPPVPEADFRDSVLRDLSGSGSRQRLQEGESTAC